MKKNTIIAACLVILGFVVSARALSPEDSWYCDGSQWVKHGNPATSAPQTQCGTRALKSPEQIDFDETGHLVKDNPGLKPGAWYLSYEKPGSPALYKELTFDNMSICEFNGSKGVCPDVLLPSSTMTRVRGVAYGDVVWVSDAVSGVSLGK